VLFHNADFAEMATWVHGVERVDARTVQMRDDDPIRLFRSFVTVVLLTRAIVE
jgi:D-amino peptidase